MQPKKEFAVVVSAFYWRLEIDFGVSGCRAVDCDECAVWGVLCSRKDTQTLRLLNFKQVTPTVITDSCFGYAMLCIIIRFSQSCKWRCLNLCVSFQSGSFGCAGVLVCHLRCSNWSEFQVTNKLTSFYRSELKKRIYGWIVCQCSDVQTSHNSVIRRLQNTTDYRIRFCELHYFPQLAIPDLCFWNYWRKLFGTDVVFPLCDVE